MRSTCSKYRSQSDSCHLPTTIKATFANAQCCFLGKGMRLFLQLGFQQIRAAFGQHAVAIGIPECTLGMDELSATLNYFGTCFNGFSQACPAEIIDLVAYRGKKVGFAKRKNSGPYGVVNDGSHNATVKLLHGVEPFGPHFKAHGECSFGYAEQRRIEPAHERRRRFLGVLANLATEKGQCGVLHLQGVES